MRVRTHTNPFNYYQRLAKIDFAQVFSDYKQELDLEIGFGRGVFMRSYAKKNPDRKIVGVEIRNSILEILAQRLEEEEIRNVFLFHGNGQIFLQDAVEDHTIANIFIFHPDPWFKTRHHKRRLIKEDFLQILEKKLKEDGRLYLSTDVKELWGDMQAVLAANSNFVRIEDENFWRSYEQTHWQKFTVEDKRRPYYNMTYVCRNTRKCK
jgi:tRNA (guanine-N7-)-methyltransferase